MSEKDPTKTETYKLGSKPSLVESFGIYGLYGYRDISLASPYAATILIAKNGSGKTTLLGALDAFLKTQFHRLQELDFSQIRCKLNGEPELLLSKEELTAFLELPADSELLKFARRIEVDPTTVFQFITGEYPQVRDDHAVISEEAVYSAALRKIGYRHRDVIATFDKLRDSVFAHNSAVKALVDVIRTALAGTEIIYLPTYRRVEIPLNEDTSERPHRRRRQQRLRLPSSVFTGDIQFGLSDIAERLSEMNQKILVNSNIGYREISAGIINELIDGTFERVDIESEEIPSKQELNIFFSRLKEGRLMGPFNDVTVPNIDKVYSGDDIPYESNRFLRYFLNKLGTVLRATRGIEAPIETFIENCNRYLRSVDASTSPPDAAGELGLLLGSDDKVLTLDRMSLTVSAESVQSGRKISLEALSSGEKQMISLFAKLFLYPNKKVILIDEPELSLSLDWQRNILPDVMNAPLCQQIIAITHSPFIFDNELEPFARSLQLSIHDGPSMDGGQQSLPV